MILLYNGAKDHNIARALSKAERMHRIMSTLDIRTKDGSTAKNKPKFYVCSHPEDHKALFDNVAKEIWALSNVALCFDGQPDSKTDEEIFFSDLQEMRLVVVIVTRRFLTESSYDRDVVMPYLASRSVPVLPLMREPGLDSLFAKVMGELQYLDVTSNDGTALPYEDKLKHYLATVLPDGDTIEQIRKAFSAYIFLSYRKMDRKDARELMRLIHTDDECRDAAIWYDEFLTPGEDFNDEIEQAIHKSALFAMAVTPNIVKNDNYIIKKEYPTAQKQGKSILPVELAPTDRKALSDTFDGIPDCVSAADTQELTAALHRTLPIRERKRRDPMHDYLIGLAYLNGVDVERNPEIALEKIHSAADAGLAAACEKLVEIYWNGDCTKIDREKALRAQKAVIAVLGKKKESSKQPEDIVAFTRALFHMAELLCEMRRYEDALRFASKARSIVDDLTLKKSNEKYDYLVSEYGLLCSELNMRLGHQGKGLALWAEALIYMNWSSDNMTDLRRRLLTVGMVILSDCEDMKADNVKTMLSMAESIYEETGNEFDKEQLARVLLWAVSRAKEEDTKNRLAKRAVELLATAEGITLSEKMQRYAAQAYLAAATVEKDAALQMQYADKAVELSAEYPQSYAHRENLAMAHLLKCGLFKTAGEKEQAQRMLELSISEIRVLAEETKNMDLYDLLFRLELPDDEAFREDALKYQTAMFERWEALYRAHPGEDIYKQKFVEQRRLYRTVKLLHPLGFGKPKDDRK